MCAPVLCVTIIGLHSDHDQALLVTLNDDSVALSIDGELVRFPSCSWIVDHISAYHGALDDGDRSLIIPGIALSSSMQSRRKDILPSAEFRNYYKLNCGRFQLQNSLILDIVNSVPGLGGCVSDSSAGSEADRLFRVADESHTQISIKRFIQSGVLSMSISRILVRNSE